MKAVDTSHGIVPTNGRGRHPPSDATNARAVATSRPNVPTGCGDLTEDIPVTQHLARRVSHQGGTEEEKGPSTSTTGLQDTIRIRTTHKGAAVNEVSGTSSPDPGIQVDRPKNHPEDMTRRDWAVITEAVKKIGEQREKGTGTAGDPGTPHLTECPRTFHLSAIGSADFSSECGLDIVSRSASGPWPRRNF